MSRSCLSRNIWEVLYKSNFVQTWNLIIVWLRFWSWCKVEILKMKCDQDLCLNLWYDPKKLFWQDELTLGSVVPLTMFSPRVGSTGVERPQSLMATESDTFSQRGWGPHIEMVADPSLLPRRQFVRLKGAASVRQGCGGTGAAIVAVLAIKSGKSGTNTTVGSS